MVPWAASSELIISRQIWPSTSLYLNICDFYLWWNLKQKVNRSNPNILEAVKIETHNIYVEMDIVT
jgi:hypothetical protein